MTYASLGKDIISSKNPSGANARYGDDFELLQMEMDKLSSPTEREQFKWQTVADYAAVVLKEQSKDILAASYLCVSLIHLEQANGLAQGVKIYDDLLHNFWDTLFPPLKRVAGRISALTWWIEQTEQALGHLTLTSQAKKQVSAHLENIDQFFGRHPELDLSTKGLIRRIKQISVNQEASPQAASGNQSEPVSPFQKPTAPDTLEQTEINTEDPVKSAQALFQKLRLVCVKLRDQDPTNPQPYHWLRYSLWSQVNGLPPAVDAKTRIAPPTQTVKAHLATLYDNNDWPGLLTAAESGLNNPKHIFFLDLNRYCAQALLNMGSQYQTAHDAVCRETDLFIRRLKGVEKLTFSDGTAFADEETRMWLSQIEPSAGNSPISQLSTMEIEGSGETTEVLETFRQMAAQKDGLIQAIGFLEQNLANNRSPKVELQYRTELARTLVSKQKEKVAIPHLIRMLDLINKYRADIWEPGISLEALKLIHKVLNKHADDRFKQQSDKAFCMATRISTVAAMQL